MRCIFMAGTVALVALGSAQAQEHAAHFAGLGTVHFPTLCAPAVTGDMNRGVALLHSFEFGGAIESFNGVLQRDSTCAMAWWGIALSRWTNPMANANRPAALLQRGRDAAVNAARLGQNATERERGYIAAVGELYTDPEHRSQATRIAAYEQAMARLVAAVPADTEARIFHAISLVASASPTDKTYAKQLAAGRTLEALWAKQPDHPGLAHYIIHSYDVPALASRAAIAARRYAEIAPDAAHALHMPSHTFTRLGKWQQSIETNQRSVDAASKSAAMGEVLHASDYMEYAYLQLRRDSAASAVLASTPGYAAKLNLTAITGAAPANAAVFALAAIPARYALERERWEEAAALTPASTAYPYADALTWYARALGAAHVGRLDDARASADTLVALRAKLVAQHEDYWAEQVGIQEQSARAWIALGEKHSDEALSLMRDAARREDATDKGAITPGPLAPARELLGGMLLSLNRPAEALAEFQKTLTHEPNRYLALAGAQRAATLVGNKALAARYTRELKALTQR